ncbi:enoyl-CoA hydratase [Qipengyuania sp. DSG2-2]
MNRLSNWSSQLFAGLGSLAVTGALMAYAIIPASPSLANSIAPVIA